MSSSTKKKKKKKKKIKKKTSLSSKKYRCYVHCFLQSWACACVCISKVTSKMLHFTSLHWRMAGVHWWRNHKEKPVRIFDLSKIDDDEIELHVLGCRLTYSGQAETSAWAWLSIAVRPRKPEGSLGRKAQDGHLDFHTAPELWFVQGSQCCWFVQGSQCCFATLRTLDKSRVQELMMKWCLMSSDVGWHIRDKLWPMPKHGSI